MADRRITRREFLCGSLAAVGLSARLDMERAPVEAPAWPVAVARCRTYELAEVYGQLAFLLDAAGGVRRLVRGKTVAVKLNLTGDIGGFAVGARSERTYQVHPTVALALAHLLSEAGARRVRFLESGSQLEPFVERLPRAGWDREAFLAAGREVEFEDTRNLGTGRAYAELRVRRGGYVYPHYLLNHSYADTDVYVSLAKLKHHAIAGVTLSLKNSFGTTPSSLYGLDAGSEEATGPRWSILHDGAQPPPAGVPAELQPEAPRDRAWRVPHIVADLAGCRPIDLAIIDGIESVAGGEGPWLPLVRTAPGLLIAGRNPVCTDAVGVAVMGYDPRTPAGQHPFPGENHLALAAAKGIGTHDLDRIEVRGLPVVEAIDPYDHYLGRG